MAESSRLYHPDGALPRNGEVFCFGSNEAGRHGRGAALVALERLGAVRGVGDGHHGMSYAIPTKGRKLEALSVDQIAANVDRFIAYAHSRQDLVFFVTAIGTGLAGYKDAQMAPLFREAPSNCILPLQWKPWA
jgi:hypothetical protein